MSIIKSIGCLENTLCNGWVKNMWRFFLVALFSFSFITAAVAQGTRLLRQPSVHDQHIVFTYGGDIWISNQDGNNLSRLTSTPALESEPFFSPDGQWIAFTSNRSGINAACARPVGPPQSWQSNVMSWRSSVVSRLVSTSLCLAMVYQFGSVGLSDLPNPR